MPIDYEAACDRAATAQGLDPLTVLEANYDYGVVQTGGFCMVGQVDRTDGKPGFVWITYEGDGFLVMSYLPEVGTDEGTVLGEALTVDEIPAILDAWLEDA